MAGLTEDPYPNSFYQYYEPKPSLIKKPLKKKKLKEQ